MSNQKDGEEFQGRLREAYLAMMKSFTIALKFQKLYYEERNDYEICRDTIKVLLDRATPVQKAEIDRIFIQLMIASRPSLEEKTLEIARTIDRYEKELAALTKEVY